MKCPCQGCSDRTAECHGTCDRYKEWKAEVDKRNEWLRSQRPEKCEPSRRWFETRARKKARGQIGKRFGRGDGE